MKLDPMKDALMARKGRGLDIQVLVDGKPVVQGTGEMKDTDLAPPGEEGAESGLPPEAAPTDPADDGEALDQEMVGQMSDHDKSDLMSRKPRSLGERAKMDAMKRMGK